MARVASELTRRVLRHRLEVVSARLPFLSSVLPSSNGSLCLAIALITGSSPMPATWLTIEACYGPDRIDAGWPGNLTRCPVSISVVPSTLMTDISPSMKFPI